MQNTALFGFGSRHFAWLCTVTMTLRCVSADELLPTPAVVNPRYDTQGSAGYVDWGSGPLPLDGIPMHSGTARVAFDVTKPKYAVLTAELANWDADLEPDGWYCRVELRNQDDGPASLASAQAAFELRVRARSDVDEFSPLQPVSIRWTHRLEVNESGIAIVKLPLRSSLPSFYIDDRGIARLLGSRKSDFVQQHQVVDRFHDINFAAGVGLALSTTRPRPVSGAIVVRVSVPSVGVLEAIDPVLVSEPLLVDSNWPQR